jgi:tetratricopeptide (TPR) repeat protein
MQKVCFVCLQPSKLKCSRCDAIQYCGKECQKKDWKVHKHNCQDNNANININGQLNNNDIFLNQANNYAKQGNYHRAEKRFRKLLEPSLRSKHTSHFLAEVFINLSIVLQNQGKYSEAIEIAQEYLDISLSKLGASHPYTLQSMDSLAKSYINLRKFNKAYELLNECIEKSTIVYGKDHDTTVAYKLSLGHAFFADGRHDEAKKLFQECLKISK